MGASSSSGKSYTSPVLRVPPPSYAPPDPFLWRETFLEDDHGFFSLKRNLYSKVKKGERLRGEKVEQESRRRALILRPLLVLTPKKNGLADLVRPPFLDNPNY